MFLHQLDRCWMLHDAPTNQQISAQERLETLVYTNCNSKTMYLYVY